MALFEEPASVFVVHGLTRLPRLPPAAVRSRLVRRRVAQRAPLPRTLPHPVPQLLVSHFAHQYFGSGSLRPRLAYMLFRCLFSYAPFRPLDHLSVALKARLSLALSSRRSSATDPVLPVTSIVCCRNASSTSFQLHAARSCSGFARFHASSFRSSFPSSSATVHRVRIVCPVHLDRDSPGSPHDAHGGGG